MFLVSYALEEFCFGMDAQYVGVERELELDKHQKDSKKLKKLLRRWNIMWNYFFVQFTKVFFGIV